MPDTENEKQITIAIDMGTIVLVGEILKAERDIERVDVDEVADVIQSAIERLRFHAEDAA